MRTQARRSPDRSNRQAARVPHRPHVGSPAPERGGDRASGESPLQAERAPPGTLIDFGYNAVSAPLNPPGLAPTSAALAMGEGGSPPVQAERVSPGYEDLVDAAGLYAYTRPGLGQGKCDTSGAEKDALRSGQTWDCLRYTEPTRVQNREEDSAEPVAQQIGGAVGPVDARTAFRSNFERGSETPQGAEQPLAPELATKLSRSYGKVLNDVCVHPNSTIARALGVRAFTSGDVIGFAPGEYQPTTPDGQYLIAHEAAHVVQQSKGGPGLPGERLANERYETEADSAADAAVAGDTVSDLSPVPTGLLQFDAGGPPTPPTPPAASSPRGKSANPTAVQAEIDLKAGTIEAGQIVGDGKVWVGLDSLGVAGELNLRKRGDLVSSRDRGDALAMNMPVLTFLHPGPLVLVVIVKDNRVTGYVAAGSPGKFIARDDRILFDLLTKAPETMGFLGMSGVKADKPTNALEGGKLQIGAKLDFTLGGWVKGATGTFAIDHEGPRFGGSATVEIAGTSGGKLSIEWDAKNGLTGNAELTIGMGPVSGEGMARLHDGVVDAQATVAYTSDRMKGSLTLIATDAKTANDITKTVGPEGKLPSIFDTAPVAAGPDGADAAPTPDKTAPGPRGLAGWGELDFSLTEWLTGQAKVVVNSQGKVTIIGKIAPPKEIVLFEQRDWTTRLFQLEARAAYGLPVIGNIFVFANVGLEALATIGPGKLYNIEINGTYSTDEAAEQSLDLKASLNISAFAGLRLRAEGGAGMEILGHDIKAGIGVWALAGVRGYVDATPTIGMRQTAGGKPEYYIKGHLDLASQLFLALGGDLFIEVDGPWWSPIDDEKWKFPIGDIEYPIPGAFGIGADVEHVLGQKTWPEVTLMPVDFDAGKFTSDLLRESPPKMGKAGEKSEDGKWSEGVAEASPPGASPSDGGKGNEVDGPKKDGQVKPGKNKPADVAPETGEPSKEGEETAQGKIGERITFTAGNEPHTMWVEVQGKTAALMIMSPRQSALAWIQAQGKHSEAESKHDGGSVKPPDGSAAGLAASIDRNAGLLAASAGDKKALKQKNEALKSDQRRLVELLQLLGAVGADSTARIVETFDMDGKRHTLTVTSDGKRLTVIMASEPGDLLAKVARHIALEQSSTSGNAGLVTALSRFEMIYASKLEDVAKLADKQALVGLANEMAEELTKIGRRYDIVDLGSLEALEMPGHKHDSTIYKLLVELSVEVLAKRSEAARSPAATGDDVEVKFNQAIKAAQEAYSAARSATEHPANVFKWCGHEFFVDHQNSYIFPDEHVGDRHATLRGRVYAYSQGALRDVAELDRDAWRKNLVGRFSYNHKNVANMSAGTLRFIATEAAFGRPLGDVSLLAMFLAAMVAEANRNNVAHVTNLLILGDTERLQEAEVFKRMPMTGGGTDKADGSRDPHLTRQTGIGSLPPSKVTDREIALAKERFLRAEGQPLDQAIDDFGVDFVKDILSGLMYKGT